MPEANDEVLYYNAFSKGFTLLTLEGGPGRGRVHQGLDHQIPGLFRLHGRQVHRAGERERAAWAGCSGSWAAASITSG